jgi:hypothetical protein
MQAAGVTSILFCTISMIFLFIGNDIIGQISFGISLFLMLLSLVTSLWEILISSNALKIELEEMKTI